MVVDFGVFDWLPKDFESHFSYGCRPVVVIIFDPEMMKRARKYFSQDECSLDRTPFLKFSRGLLTTPRQLTNVFLFFSCCFC